MIASFQRALLPKKTLQGSVSFFVPQIVQCSQNFIWCPFVLANFYKCAYARFSGTAIFCKVLVALKANFVNASARKMRTLWSHARKDQGGHIGVPKQRNRPPAAIIGLMHKDVKQCFRGSNVHWVTFVLT